MYRARVEYFTAKNSDVWYFAALAVAVAVNLIVFFAGKVDYPSSMACSVNCDDRGLFDWVAASWAPTGVRSTFGLQLSGVWALVIRLLCAIHVALASAMFIGWLAVPGRVYLGSMKSANVARYRITMDESPFHTVAVFEKRKRTTRASAFLLYLRLLRNSGFLAHLAYFLISLAGFTVSPMFFCLELFSLAYRVKIFNEIINAVVSNPTRLLTTIVLGIIGLWMFVLLGVAFFQRSYILSSSDTADWPVFCADFKSCLSYHIQFGVMSAPTFGSDWAPQYHRIL
jgi:hypothetical protein